MNDHLDHSLLSACLDGDATPEQQQHADVHLAACPRCTDTLRRMRRVSTLLGHLAEVELSEHQSRVLRRAVGRAAGGRGRIAALGAVSGIAAALLAVVLLNRPAPVRSPTAADAAAEMSATREAVIESERDLRAMLLADPSIKEGAGKFTVADVGAGAGRAEALGAPAPESDKSPLTQQDCLGKVGSIPDYPIVLLVSRSVVFKGVPAWMFIYAFTSRTADDAPLDRIQVWVMERGRCSELHVLTFKP